MLPYLFGVFSTKALAENATRTSEWGQAPPQMPYLGLPRTPQISNRNSAAISWGTSICYIQADIDILGVQIREPVTLTLWTDKQKIGKYSSLISFSLMFSFRPSNWLNFELNFGLLLLLLRLRSSTCPRTHKRTSWAEMTTAATIIYFFLSQPSPLRRLWIWTALSVA